MSQRIQDRAITGAHARVCRWPVVDDKRHQEPQGTKGTPGKGTPAQEAPGHPRGPGPEGGVRASAAWRARRPRLRPSGEGVAGAGAARPSEPSCARPRPSEAGAASGAPCAQGARHSWRAGPRPKTRMRSGRGSSLLSRTIPSQDTLPATGRGTAVFYHLTDCPSMHLLAMLNATSQKSSVRWSVSPLLLTKYRRHTKAQGGLRRHAGCICASRKARSRAAGVSRCDCSMLISQVVCMFVCSQRPSVPLDSRKHMCNLGMFAQLATSVLSLSCPRRSWLR